jgi:hypothetical protein
MNLLKLAQDKVHKAIGAKPASANDFNVGDSLIHTTSGVRGVLEGVEICDGRVLLTIRTPSGQFLHKLGRQEFKLASEASASEFAPAHAEAPAAAPVETHGAASSTETKQPAAAEPELDLKMDCSEGISTESILDEL